MAVYYTEPEKIAAGNLVIEGAEAHHIGRVMRFKKGDPLTVVDGIGNGFRAEIMSVSGKRVTCSVLSRIRRFGEPLTDVTLAAGWAAGSRFDDIIQKGTELGISRFVPLICDKGRVKIDDESRLQNRLRRWRKVALASIKQCERSVLPEITAPTGLSDLLAPADNERQVILFDPSGNRTLYDFGPPEEGRRYLILVGPEAGFVVRD